jgi:very-short-patch-repair endonuclease
MTRWKQLNQGLPDPEPEYRFAALHVGLGNGIRKRLEVARLQDWRADFCWPDTMLIVEIEGGTFSGGRHVRGVGYAADCKKYNAAQRLGYVVLRYTSDMINNDIWSIMQDIADVIGAIE